MTPARSVAASVFALGFAGSLAAPTPAFAAPCQQAGNYAAQSGAEMLRIDQLAGRSGSSATKSSRLSTPPPPSMPSSSSGRSDSDSSGRSDGDSSGRSGAGSSGHSDNDSSGRSGGGSSGGSHGDQESVTDSAAGLLGSDPTGDIGNSGQGVSGFLSGTGDLLKSITNGGVTAPGGPLSVVGSGGQAGGGPISSSPSSASSVDGVGLGETKAAMIADARTNAVAVGRIVDGEGPLSKPLIQSAPPNRADATRHTGSGSAGPLGYGAGDLLAHAKWDAAMACGNAVGEVAHSSASLKRIDLLDGTLLHTGSGISSLSSTAMSRDGAEPRSVAAATITAGKLTLADGKIKLQFLEPPTLTASMGATTGGQVAYQPPKLKVTWPGGNAKTLTIAGDSVDITLGAGDHPSESAGLPKIDGLMPTSELPLPAIPGLPSLPTAGTESAPVAKSGVTVRISLGDVRRATKSNAIAAKASAVKVAISEACGCEKPSSDKPDDRGRGTNGYGDAGSSGSSSAGSSASSSVVAQMSLGLLEAAVVGPEAAAPGTPGTPGAGAAAALPITGSQASLIAVGGLGLLAAGGAALLTSRRRRRTHP